MDKTQTLDLIKNELYFCTNEYFYGKSRPYVQTFVCQHPQYQWPLCFDLKHDPNIYLEMPIKDLTLALKKNPKFLRTVRHNKHPIIMNPSYGKEFDDYKTLGVDKLSDRAKLIKENKNFSKKIMMIKQEEADEKEQLYGAVSKKEIINYFSDNEIKILSDDLKIIKEIRSLGEHIIEINPYEGLVADLKVKVVKT